MLKTTPPPTTRYAENLRILLELTGRSVADVAAAAKVIPKQVYNLLNKKHDSRIKGLEKVANVFGLAAWQMLAVDLTDKPADNKAVLTLLELYSAADESGRATIMRVAEIAASTPRKPA